MDIGIKYTNFDAKGTRFISVEGVHGHWIDNGRLDEDTVEDMWRSMETIHRPSATMKEAIIICRQGQVTIHSTSRSKAAGRSWDEGCRAPQGGQPKAPPTLPPHYGIRPGSSGDHGRSDTLEQARGDLSWRLKFQQENGSEEHQTSSIRLI